MFIAGFDGFDETEEDNFVNSSFQNNRHNPGGFSQVNEDIGNSVCTFAKTVNDEFQITFITPTHYRRFLENTNVKFLRT